MKDDYYFPHFMNARNDRKIRRVRKDLGAEGYGAYFMTLEVLRSQSQYRYPIDDLDLLADELGVGEQKLRVVICNYGLFEVDDEQMFFSPKLLEYIQPYLEQKEKNSYNGLLGNLKRWHPSIYKRVQTGEITMLEGKRLLDEMPMLSGGDSGGNRDLSQSKGNQNKKNEINISFESFYQSYGKKMGKEKARRAWGKLTDAEREEAARVSAAANKYHSKDRQYQPYPATWLNGKLWQDDCYVEISAKSDSATKEERFEYLDSLGRNRSEKEEIEYWNIKTGHAG